MNIDIAPDVNIDELRPFVAIVRIVRGAGGRPVLHALKPTRIRRDATGPYVTYRIERTDVLPRSKR